MDPATPNQNQTKEPEPVVVRREPERDLVIWSAPARPFKRRDRRFYVTVIGIVGIVCLVLFLAEGWMPVILLTSLVFLFYVMNTVEPETIEYKITTKGIGMAGKKVEWNTLGRFWFSRRYDNELLVLETSSFPGRMEFVVGMDKKEEIRKSLSAYLLEEEVPPSSLDKAANWFAKKLPGNK